MEYDNELSGALFRNTSKREGKKDPDYNGRCTIGGTEYWISSWINESKGGVKFMSLKFREKEQKPPATAPVAQEPFIDDDVPF